MTQAQTKACGCTTDCGHDHTPQQDKAASAGQVNQFGRNEFAGVKAMRVRGPLR